MINKSLAEFRAEVFDALALTCPFEIRRGQFVFNYVAKKYEQVAREVAVNIIDPFYNDDNIERFLLEVYNKLTKPSNQERIAKWDLERCRIYLLLYNAWRRGDENLEQPDPEVIGLVLDRMCDIIYAQEFPTQTVSFDFNKPIEQPSLFGTRYYRRAFRAITTGHSNRRRTQTVDFEAIDVCYPQDKEVHRRLIQDITSAKQQQQVAIDNLNRAMSTLSNVIDGREDDFFDEEIDEVE